MSWARCLPVVPRVAVMACLMAACAPAAGIAAPAPPAAEACALAELPGLSAQFLRARRESRAAAGAAASSGLDAAHSADFWRVARAVVGPAADEVAALPDAAVETPPRAAVPCDTSVRARDRVAWQLGLSGYTAREIADVLEGHLTRADLDEARARLMAGHADASVAAFLDGRWRELLAEAPPAVAAAARGMDPALPDLAELEVDLAAFAAEHRVPAALVRAVVAAESAGNPRAVSSAGAIGLMQLMPGTAASLGVNPWQPRENLRGGITYLGSLLRAFDGNTRLALIAYNAGPQHAREVRAGRAVAYRETRQYLATIGARYPLPQGRR
jgi:soluble lytic murein transglycosylase-like protein